MNLTAAVLSCSTLSFYPKNNKNGGVSSSSSSKKGISDSEIYLRFHPQDTFYWCDFKGKEKPCISDGLIIIISPLLGSIYHDPVPIATVCPNKLQPTKKTKTKLSSITRSDTLAALAAPVDKHKSYFQHQQ